MNSLLSHSTSGTIPRFNRHSRILRARPGQFLSDEELRAAAPSIFAQQAHGSRSQRYAYIPTSEVLSGLRKEGFQPVFVTQGRTKDEAKQGHTKHMLRLRHQSAPNMEVGGTFNEIVLLNSHDGTSSYQLMAGLFRMVCSNGMIVGAGTGFDEIRVKHTGDAQREVIDGAIEILARLPEVNDRVAGMHALRLNEGERLAFARAALALRYEEAEKAPIPANRLLKVERREDAAPTIWNTLNTVQEHTINGGLRYDFTNDQGRVLQRRKTREIAGIDQNVALNRGLWVLAEEMAKLKQLQGAAA